MRNLCFIALAGMASGLMGCAGGKVCTGGEPANLWVSGSERLNEDASGRPLPTMVRVYQLTGLGEVEMASFEQLLGAPDRIFKDTLLATEELTVYPGRSAFRAFEREAGAQYVVAVAAVRKPSGDQFRSILALPRCGESSVRPMVRFVIDGYRIQGSVQREKKPEGCKDEDAECLVERAK